MKGFVAKLFIVVVCGVLASSLLLCLNSENPWSYSTKVSKVYLIWITLSLSCNIYFSIWRRSYHLFQFNELTNCVSISWNLEDVCLVIFFSINYDLNTVRTCENSHVNPRLTRKNASWYDNMIPFNTLQCYYEQWKKRKILFVINSEIFKPKKTLKRYTINFFLLLLV